MQVYKITNLENQTYKGFQYRPKHWRVAARGDGPLCSRYWLHSYADPNLAVLFNPIHGAYLEPFRLWKAEAAGRIRKGSTKLGSKRLRLMRHIPVPEYTMTQRVAFGILCMQQLPHLSLQWVAWSIDWLNGTDRSEAAARGASNLNLIEMAQKAREY